MIYFAYLQTPIFFLDSIVQKKLAILEREILRIPLQFNLLVSTNETDGVILTMAQKEVTFDNRN